MDNINDELLDGLVVALVGWKSIWLQLVAKSENVSETHGTHPYFSFARARY